MKILILGTLLFSKLGIAQTLDINGLKQLLTTNRSTLETIKQGMSKKLTTTSKVATNQGVCDYMIISTQTVLKIEGDKIIIHTNDKFSPAASPACNSAGYRSFEENILFYEKKPNLTSDLADLDISAPAITSIVRDKNIVTLLLNISDHDPYTNTTYRDNVTVKYDITKPSFKNVVLNQGNEYKTIGEDRPDVNVSTINLSNVHFCENNDGDNSECVRGNFSDILY